MYRRRLTHGLNPLKEGPFADPSAVEFHTSRTGNQSVCSEQLWPCRLLIFRNPLVDLISFLFLQLMINMGQRHLRQRVLLRPRVKKDVAISCGALLCKSPSGSGPRMPLPSVFSPCPIHGSQCASSRRGGFSLGSAMEGLLRSPK